MCFSVAIGWSNHFKPHDGSWYGLTRMRVVSMALLVIAACSGGGYHQNLPLQGRGVGGPMLPLAPPPPASSGS